jgi:Na+/H+-translocating membrane pyrophosphatase
MATKQVSMPLVVGFWMGPRVLVAFIAGSILGGGIFAIFCQNAGAVWYRQSAFYLYPLCILLIATDLLSH